MNSANPSLFIGLGVMVRPRVTHLAAAGHAVTLFDRAAGLAEEIAATLPAARIAADPRELLEGLGPGSLPLDTSSSEPWLTDGSGRLLAEAGVTMVSV